MFRCSGSNPLENSMYRSPVYRIIPKDIHGTKGNAEHTEIIKVY